MPDSYQHGQNQRMLNHERICQVSFEPILHPHPVKYVYNQTWYDRVIIHLTGI